MDGKTALAFWERYPSPSCLEGVSIKQLTTFLLEVSHNTCSVKKANEILKLVIEDGNTTKNIRKLETFGRKHCAPHLFGKQEIGKVERELKELMSLLDF